MKPHPTLPLHAEFTAALQRLSETATQADVVKLRRRFTELRDRMFPNWQTRYSEEVEAWSKKA